MFLSKNQIKRNITWLLSNATPPVTYLTQRYILKIPLDSASLINLWQQVLNCKIVQEVFSKQKRNGSWCDGGSWALKPSYLPKQGCDPYTPKYVTAAWILPILGNMGFTNSDKRIRKARDYVLSNGYFLNPIFESPTTIGYLHEADFNICRFSQYLLALGSVSLESDDNHRIKQGYQLLLNSQREDGGWALDMHFRQRNWTRSCPWSTYHAASALYYSKNKTYYSALVKALKFLIWHLSTKSDNERCRFFYHGHSTVHELMMFSDLQIGPKEKPIHVILEWLMSMYHENEAHFKYNGKPVIKYSLRQDGMDARVAKYRLYHLIEDDWLTYYMTKIGTNLIK